MLQGTVVGKVDTVLALMKYMAAWFTSDIVKSSPRCDYKYCEGTVHGAIKTQDHGASAVVQWVNALA